MVMWARPAPRLARANRFRKGGGKVYVGGPEYGETDPSLMRFGSDPKRREQLRVLIAEEERSRRDDAASRLSRHGMRVVKVGSPADIEPMLKRFRPHVLVLDDRFERSGVDFKAILPVLVGTFPSIGVVVTAAAKLVGGKKANDPLTWGARDVIDKRTMFQGTTLQDSVIKAAGILNP